MKSQLIIAGITSFVSSENIMCLSFCPEISDFSISETYMILKYLVGSFLSNLVECTKLDMGGYMQFH